MTNITDIELATWVAAIATCVVAITAVISIILNRTLIAMTIAKDRPFIRAYIKKIQNPPYPPILFVKNEEGGRAANVTLDISGRKFGPYSLKANESEDISIEVTDGLRIDYLTYEDIHGHKTTERNIFPKTITVDFGMR